MSIKGRLSKLERGRETADGSCPGCGYRPDDIRTIVIGRQPPGECRPFCEVVADDRPQPGRPLCPICGGYMPPTPIIDNTKNAEGQSADVHEWNNDRRDERIGGTEQEGG